RGAGVLLHLAGDDDRGLLRELVGPGEDLGGHVLHVDDALDDAGAVAELEEVELARGAFVVEPALEGDLLALHVGEVPGDVLYVHGALGNIKKPLMTKAIALVLALTACGETKPAPA